MNRLRKYQTDLLISAALLILPLVLYGAVTIGDRTMLPADNLFQWAPWRSAAASFDAEIPHNALLSDLILQNYPWKRFIRESLGQGEIPLWNPYLFAGAPFLAAGQNAGYYPFSLLFLILPLAKAYGWFTVSQLWLAGVLMYWLGRALGQRRAGAALAGLVYQGCGFMLVSAAVFPMIISAAAWLPLPLLCIEMILQRTTAVEGAGRTLPWVVLGASTLGLQLLAGHVEITYYTLIVIAFYAAWRLGFGLLAVPGRELARPAVWLGLMVTVGLMLGAIQLIPLYEVGQDNFRQGAATLAEVRGWGFPARRILTLALPDFFGNPAVHSYRDAFTGAEIPFSTNYHGQVNPHGPYTSSWGIKNYVEGGIYLGIMPLLLAALGLWAGFRPGQRPADPVGQRLWRRRRSQTGFFLTLSLLSLAFVFGTPLYALIYYLPYINQLHSPFRWVFPLSLSVAALAGFGLDYLGTAVANHRPRRLTLPALLGWLAAGGGLLLLAGLAASWIGYASLEPAIERVFLGLALAPDAFADARAFYSYQFWQLLYLGQLLVASGGLLLLHRRAAGRRLTLWTLAVLLLAGFDLGWVGYGFNAAVDPALLEYRPEMVRWLAEQPGHWRLTSFDSKGSKPFNANAGWLFDLPDIRGYDSIIPRQYTDYMAAIEPQNELQYNRVQPIGDWEALNSPLLDLLAVRYIVTEEELALPKLRLAWQGEAVRVYENLAAAPRAFTLPQTATLVAPDPLAVLRERDPRQLVVVAVVDWPGGEPATAVPATLAPATIAAAGNIEVVVTAVVDEPAWLVLADSYFPGWTAHLRPAGADETDEQALEIYQVNGNFRGVRLPPGEWTVRFRYSPLSFKLGGLVSFMSGIILLFAGAVWGWRRYYRPQGELTNTRSIAKNSLAPMILNLFNRGIDFVFAAFYLRLLGPVDTGSYFTAIAIAGWFEIISNFGLNTLVIREVSQDRSQATRYLVNTTVLRLFTSLIGSIPIMLYFAGVNLSDNPLDANTAAAILLLMAGMIFSGMGQGVAGLFYAYETAERPAAIATVTTILKVAFGVAVLLLGFGFVGLAAVSIFVNVITLGILGVVAFRDFPLRQGNWSIDFGLQRRMLAGSYPLMLNHLLAVVFFQIDVPLLRQINGEAVVGWYNSAYKYVNAYNIIPSFFTFALFPVISRQVQSDLAGARRTYRMSLKLLMLVALPLAAVTTLLAHGLIGLLGGAEFLPDGAIALQVVIWSIPFGWLNSVTNYVLIALGQERRLTRAFVVGVGFNVIANLIVLPRFSYVGAAATTILSEIILLVLFNRYLRQRLPEIRWLRLMWRPATAALAMVLAMLAGAQLHWLLGLGAGLVVYPAGLWALRVFGEEERHILASILPGAVASRLKLTVE